MLSVTEGARRPKGASSHGVNKAEQHLTDALFPNLQEEVPAGPRAAVGRMYVQVWYGGTYQPLQS